MTKIEYDRSNRALYVKLSDEQPIADETIEQNLTLGWGENGQLIEVCLMDVDPPAHLEFTSATQEEYEQVVKERINGR